MLLLLSAIASAGSLDQIEVGGPWGTPTADDATAVWWNPAAAAAGEGTRMMLEIAPTFATVTYERTAPHPGSDLVRMAGVLPYAGVVTDFGVDGLAIGAALVVPTVRGGVSEEPLGAGRFALKDGRIQAVYGMLSGAYRPIDQLAIGGGIAVVQSSWAAISDKDTMPELYEALDEAGSEPDYSDADLEDPDYNVELTFDHLKDVAVTGSGSIWVQPHELVEIGVTYIHGARVDNSGELRMAFECPPQSDTLGRFGAESRGICDTDVKADATVGYTLPPRVHGGVAVSPSEKLRVELMGGWVRWSVFQDFDITIANVGELNPELPEATVDQLNQKRQWARDNEDSIWAALDLKFHPNPRVLVGGRVAFDQAAVPDHAVITNNYDADDLMLSGIVAFAPVQKFEFGLSYTHHLLSTRTISGSAFSNTLDHDNVPADRYNYPHGNGTYAGSIGRVGLQARLKL